MPLFTNHLLKESELVQFGIELLRAYQMDLSRGLEISLSDLRIALFAIQKALESSHIAKVEAILYPAVVDTKLWQKNEEEIQTLVKNVYNLHAGIRLSLLALGIAINEYEGNKSLISVLSWRLSDFADRSSEYLALEKQMLRLFAEKVFGLPLQKKLYLLAQDFENTYGIHQLQGPRQIINKLRQQKGLLVA